MYIKSLFALYGFIEKTFRKLIVFCNCNLAAAFLFNIVFAVYLTIILNDIFAIPPEGFAGEQEK
jgi:hypothetical protein